MKEKDSIKKELEHAEKTAEFQEKVYSESEESFDRDVDRYAGRTDQEQMAPQDFYQYKHMVLRPNSESKFEGLADKDTVLANYKKHLPDPVHQKIIVETCVAIKRVFVKKKLLPYLDHEGKQLFEEKMVDGVRRKAAVMSEQLVFDENFRVILDFLQAGHKFEEVSSRAMGNERAAILDRSNLFGKSLKKSGSGEEKGKKRL